MAGKSDVDLVMLHPRTAELHAIGALGICGQSETEGPIYFANLATVSAPSPADRVERQLNTLTKATRVSIAAGIMAREGKRAKHARPGREQAEFL